MLEARSRGATREAPVAGYRKVPAFVHDAIAQCSTDTFQVGRTRSYTLEALSGGELHHLDVRVEDGRLQHPDAVVPPVSRGRWSRYNVNGQEHRLRDRTKITKRIGGWQVPNFGDWSRGSHTHWHDKEVFEKETWYARQLAVQIDSNPSEGEEIVVGFRVEQVFDRRVLDPEDRDLRLACSLIRENLGGHASVVPADLTVEDWLANERVHWEILSVGEGVPRPFTEILARLPTQPSPERAARMEERYSAVNRMHPSAVVVGEGEFARYFGFEFREDLVALECLDYGNALYLMYRDWKTLSQRSRVDLISDKSEHYDRIVHRPGWEDVLRLCWSSAAMPHSVMLAPLRSR
jgi:hypothetical protein